MTCAVLHSALGAGSLGTHLDGISNYFAGHKRVLHAGGTVGLAVANDDGIMQEGLASRSFNLRELVIRGKMASQANVYAPLV
jgi:hypothetical protein